MLSLVKQSKEDSSETRAFFVLGLSSSPKCKSTGSESVRCCLGVCRKREAILRHGLCLWAYSDLLLLHKEQRVLQASGLQRIWSEKYFSPLVILCLSPFILCSFTTNVLGHCEGCHARVVSIMQKKRGRSSLSPGRQPSARCSRAIPGGKKVTVAQALCLMVTIIKIEAS